MTQLSLPENPRRIKRFRDTFAYGSGALGPDRIAHEYCAPPYPQHGMVIGTVPQPR